MAVKLHRCPSMFIKIQGHPCWRVQSALNKAGIDYEVVKGPLRRSKRTEVMRISGQSLYPVIQFEDGTVYREESKDMAARIRAGNLRPQAQAAAAPPAGTSEFSSMGDPPPSSGGSRGSDR